MILADRKKVQQIRTKRVSKSKNTGSDGIKKIKPIKPDTSTIKMTPEKTTKKSDGPKQIRREQSNANKANRNTFDRTADSKFIKPPKKNNGFSVIRGKKGEIKKKRLITLSISFIVIISVLIFCLTSPTGPIERITNAFAVMGSGDYPAVMTGTSVDDLQTTNNKIFALTNSHLCGYNYSGNNFLLLQHDFSNPVLDTSEERVLLYNRESNKFNIANNSGSLFDENLEQAIFCGDISYNGSVAFVCDSSSFAAQILVFDKNMEQYYTWYLADGLVSDITVSDDGEYVALAVLKVKNGSFSSEIYCLDTEKEEPLYVKELAYETVYRVESVSSSNFVYTSDKNLEFVDWETGKAITNNNFGSASYFSSISDYYLALYGEASRSDILLYNSSGEIEEQFEYNGIIDSISIFDERVYILTGNKVNYFDFSGKNQKTISLDSKPDYIVGVDDGFISINNIDIDFVSVE